MITFIEFLTRILENYGVYILTIYVFLITMFSNDPFLLLLNISTIILILGKWVTNINVCAAGIVECKLRNVSRTDSYIYRILDGTVKVNQTNIIYLYYILYISMLIITIKKFIDTKFNLFRIQDYIDYINDKVKKVK